MKIYFLSMILVFFIFFSRSNNSFARDNNLNTNSSIFIESISFEGSSSIHENNNQLFLALDNMLNFKRVSYAFIVIISLIFLYFFRKKALNLNMRGKTELPMFLLFQSAGILSSLLISWVFYFIFYQKLIGRVLSVKENSVLLTKIMSFGIGPFPIAHSLDMIIIFFIFFCTITYSTKLISDQTKKSSGE